MKFGRVARGGHHRMRYRSGRNRGHNLWPPKTACDPVTVTKIIRDLVTVPKNHPWPRDRRRMHAQKCTRGLTMAEYSSTLFCSVSANVNGIKFYPGVEELQSLKTVKFERDHSCVQDCNAIFIKFEDGSILGHLEQHVSKVIAPLLDLPGFIIKGYNII